MAHYAFVEQEADGRWIVREVIVGRDEDEGVDWEQVYAEIRGLRCLRTSYWTRDGINTRTGGAGFRGNYEGISYVYDEARDEFLPPDQPANTR